MPKPTASNGRPSTLVVLGAAVWPGGVASPTLARRTEWGCALFRQGGYDLIVMSGGVGDNPPAEAEVMADIASRAGLPTQAVVLDRAARVTIETAAFAARMPGSLTRHFVAVTDRYHALRTWLAFRAYRLDVTVSCPPHRQGTPITSLVRSYLREAPAMLLYAGHFLRIRLQARR